MNIFKNNLRYLVREFGIKQIQLAVFIGKSQNSISNWINEVSVPDLRDLMGMSHYFGVSIDAMAFQDLEKSGLITKAHIAQYKPSAGNAGGMILGTGKLLAPEYYRMLEDNASVLQEQEATAGWAIMGQLKSVHEKLDDIQAITHSLAKERKK